MPKNTTSRIKELFAKALSGRRRVVLDSACIALALALGALVAAASVQRTVELGPVDVTARLSAGFPGRTTVQVPPFGELWFRTHRGPARIVVSVDAVDVARVEELIANEKAAAQLKATADDLAATTGGVSAAVDTLDAGAVTGALGVEVGHAVRGLIWLVAGAALVAAAVAALVLLALRRRARVVVIGAAAGLVLVLGSTAIAGATFDPAGFSSPQMRGALTYVPQLQSIFSARLSNIAQLRSAVVEAADKLAAYYADPRSITTGGGLAGTYRVLHVTDLHLDPVGAEFARALARSYEASLVVDTGDLAIGGTAQETALLPSLVITSTPVVYVPGNHDSPAVTRALGSFPNYTVATTEAITVDGLTIVTVPDPSSASSGIEPSKSAATSATEDALALLEARERSGFAPPQIVALHNPIAEKILLDRVPIILSGHTHSARLYRHANTIRLNSGTTGGMPYDPVATGKKRLPHGAAVLYYTATLPRRLIAIDAIEVGVNGTTSLDRTVVDATLLP